MMLKNLKNKPHLQLLLALFLGMISGILCRQFAASDFTQLIITNGVEPLGQLFLRLIFMTVVPVVFFGLVLGVYQLAGHQGLGSTVRKTLFYTLIASSISVLIGISLVNFFQPGNGMNLPSEVQNQSAVEKIASNASAAKPLAQTLLDLVPKNPLWSATQAFEGEMIALMVFSLFFGFALSRTIAKDSANPTINMMESIYNACMEIVLIVMKMAPLAVFCLVFTTSYKFGIDILISLSFYVGVVVLGLLMQQFLVYPTLLKLIAKRSPVEFFKKSLDVLLYAFATASSNATLPKALDTAVNKLHLSPEKSRFVLTVGSTANQNGTALFEGITVLFLAQVYGIDLSLAQQIQVVLMSILAGIGTAGVPGGSLPLIMILLQQVGIPPEGLGIILGVDRFLDMCRTTINVSGDLVISALVDSKKEKI